MPASCGTTAPIRCVHVDEVARSAAHEVLVGDVAPAGHGDRAVGDEELVVHAVVQAREVGQRCRETCRRGFARPQQKGLNSRTSTFGNAAKRAKQPVGADGVEVVDQEAHAHAAQRRVAQVRMNRRPVRSFG